MLVGELLGGLDRDFARCGELVVFECRAAQFGAGFGAVVGGGWAHGVLRRWQRAGACCSNCPWLVFWDFMLLICFANTYAFAWLFVLVR